MSTGEANAAMASSVMQSIAGTTMGQKLVHDIRGGCAAATIAPMLLSEDQAAALFGVSVRKFAELRSEDWMPKPIQLGPRLLRWSRSELEAAIVSMPRLRAPTPEPLHLAKTRAAGAGRTDVAL